ncbi:sulfotransferase domain-containing protein [Nodosilinea sp. E11]|uniref:sulfotransferase domain-containing protein n=1 Tax=Nodosilinea sp. E11 TaxID=3037479 RepID=UPI002934C533|nr:sulfotransferase domain-containing protein [Nodosilinea sp. E11]WOD36908.1 sulfotransferase domain-containing protein [Nodosilinea sp. E11]
MVTNTYLRELITHTQKALNICSKNTKIYQHLGELYKIQKDFEQASYYYIEAIKLSPAPSSCFYSLHFTLQAMNWFGGCSDTHLIEDGVLALRQVVQENSDFNFSKIVLGELLAQQGNIEEATSYYRSASYHQTMLSHPELVKKSWDNSFQRQPNFLIVGFPKCGTTSLYSYLASHPKILPTATKEIRQINLSEMREIDLYLSHFPTITDSSYLTFEASPSSILFPKFLRDLSKHLSKTKVIILLRNPVNRSISEFYFAQKILNIRSPTYFEESVDSLLNSEDPCSIFELLSRFSLYLTDETSLKQVPNFYQDEKILQNGILPHILGSFYIYYLKAWLQYFSKEKVLILQSEDLFQKPVEVMEKVYEFLGLATHALSQYHNSNPNTYPLVSKKCRNQMENLFRPYNQQLESYLDMQFNW